MMDMTVVIAGCALATLISGAGGVAVRWILTGQNDIKDDIKCISDGFERRVDRLEQQSRDFMPAGKITADIGHAKANTLQVIEGVKESTSRHNVAIENLRDRVTVLETKHETTTMIVNEIKSELKETRGEINHRLDQMASTQEVQFNQLCASIREISTRGLK